MKKYIFLLLVIGFFFMGCSNPFSDNHSEQLESKISDDKLVLLNKSSSAIYSVAMDENLAAVVNWAPVSNEETLIEPFTIKEVLLSDLSCQKPCANIIVFYWTSKKPGSEDIRSILVER